MWLMGLVATRHVESSKIRDRTHVPCIGRWILNHWTAREVLNDVCLTVGTGRLSDTHIHPIAHSTSPLRGLPHRHLTRAKMNS